MISAEQAVRRVRVAGRRKAAARVVPGVCIGDAVEEEQDDEGRDDLQTPEDHGGEGRMQVRDRDRPVRYRAAERVVPAAAAAAAAARGGSAGAAAR